MLYLLFMLLILLAGSQSFANLAVNDAISSAGIAQSVNFVLTAFLNSFLMKRWSGCVSKKMERCGYKIRINESKCD